MIGSKTFFRALALSLCLVALISLGANADESSELSEDFNRVTIGHREHKIPFNTAVLSGALLPSTNISDTIYLPLVDNSELPTPEWLDYLNSFRVATGLRHLTENNEWSEGDWSHSRYMVKNDYVGHNEDAGNPWYTTPGQLAAQNGNVFVSSWLGTTDQRAIDFWMSAPFHAISIVDPQLYETGFGSYREAIGLWKMAATLDVGRGRGVVPDGTQFPIAFPSDGGTTSLLSYLGGEFPDPLTSCPGYSPPTGPPIMLQIGSGDLIPSVTHVELTKNGNTVGICHFNETNYLNPDSYTQYQGRWILGSRDAIVIMPRQPLVPASTYMVQVVSNGTSYEWSFATLADADALDAMPGELVRIGSIGE